MSSWRKTEGSGREIKEGTLGLVKFVAAWISKLMTLQVPQIEAPGSKALSHHCIPELHKVHMATASCTLHKDKACLYLRRIEEAIPSLHSWQARGVPGQSRRLAAIPHASIYNHQSGQPSRLCLPPVARYLERQAGCPSREFPGQGWTAMLPGYQPIHWTPRGMQHSCFPLSFTVVYI